MGDSTIPDTSFDQTAHSARRRGNLRPLRLLLLSSAGTALTSAVLVVPGWIPALSRPARRELTEAIIQTVLVVYSVLFALACIGTIVAGWLLARSIRARGVEPKIAKLFLAGVSCLAGVLLLELGAAGWRAWMHRFPRLPTDFVATPAGEYRIVVLGGSSAAGEPYWPWLSVGQILTWKLSEAVRDQRFQCETLAYPGDSLEMQHHKLATLEHRPDLVLIYAGHNEFVARFEEEREGWLDEQSATSIARLTRNVTSRSHFCALAYELISKNRLDRPPSLALRHELIDPPLCSHVEWAQILDDFRSRLEAILSYCDQIDALPVLIIPPANESGYEPGRSTISPSVPAGERRRLVDEFRAARALESTDPRSSEAGYLGILRRHPGFAEAHFRLARLLEQHGRVSAAGPHYLAALDDDGLPLRCPAPFRAAIRETAGRHPRGILIDGRRELIATSPNGLIGDRLIHDTHHPTLPGYVALAAAILRQLDERKVFPNIYRSTSPLDPAECAAHFGMNAERWSDVCDRVSQHYKRVAGYRYDPAERIEKSRRFAEAARRIGRGEPIGDLGLPGIPAAVIPGHRQEVAVPDSGPHTGRSLPAAGDRSVGNDLHLPVLQINGSAAAKEPDQGHELITLRPANHLTDHTGERARRDANGRSNGHRVFRSHRQAGAQHGVNLLEVARQCLLIVNFEHAHQTVRTKGRQPGILIPLQEQITHEKRYNRMNFPPAGGMTVLEDLGQVVGEPQSLQVARGRFFLTGFCM